MTALPELLTAAEAAAPLKVHKSYVYKLVKLGLLPAVAWTTPGKGNKPAPVIRIRPADLQQFIDDHLTTGQEVKPPGSEVKPGAGLRVVGD